MTLQELLEQAHLDAMGLLDPADQAAFEDAFASAPPAVKAQIRAEQARWAASEALLPDVEPPAHLRARVLDAVQLAMSESAMDGGRSFEEEFETSPRQRRVSPMWRAASLGLIAASVVLGVSFVKVYSDNRRITDSFSDVSLREQLLSDMGASYRSDVLFDASTRRITFESPASANGFEGRASLYVSSKWNDSVLLWDGLPKVSGVSYRLVVLNDQGKVEREVAGFDGGAERPSLRVNEVFAKGMKLAVVEAAIGARATADRVLMVATV